MWCLAILQDLLWCSSINVLWCIWLFFSSWDIWLYFIVWLFGSWHGCVKYFVWFSELGVLFFCRYDLVHCFYVFVLLIWLVFLFWLHSCLSSLVNFSIFGVCAIYSCLYESWWLSTLFVVVLMMTWRIRSLVGCGGSYMMPSWVILCELFYVPVSVLII